MPTCPKCGYDLGGCQRDAHEAIACPECGEAWSETIERGLKVWSGWRGCIRNVVLVPAIAWGVILACLLAGLVLPEAPFLVYLLWPTPFIIGFFAPIVVASESSLTPRIRRPHAGLILLFGFAATIGLHVLGGALTYGLLRIVR